MRNRKLLVVGLGGLMAWLTWSFESASAQQAFINKGNGAFKAAELVCDQKTLVSTVEFGDADAPVYISWNKPGLTGGVVLNEPRPNTPGCGAGTCYFQWVNGSYVYTVSRSNVLDEVRSLPNGRVSVTKGDQFVYDETCYAPSRAVVQCITRDRSIYVIKNTNGTYSYKSFDYASANPAMPALTLGNGAGYIGGASGLATYSFNNGAYNYQLQTEPRNPSATFGYARLVVKNGGSVILDQLCDAYTLGIGAL